MSFGGGPPPPPPPPPPRPPNQLAAKQLTYAALRQSAFKREGLHGLLRTGARGLTGQPMTSGPTIIGS